MPFDLAWQQHVTAYHFSLKLAIQDSTFFTLFHASHGWVLIPLTSKCWDASEISPLLFSIYPHFLSDLNQLYGLIWLYYFCPELQIRMTTSKFKTEFMINSPPPPNKPVLPENISISDNGQYIFSSSFSLMLIFNLSKISILSSDISISQYLHYFRVTKISC